MREPLEMVTALRMQNMVEICRKSTCFVTISFFRFIYLIIYIIYVYMDIYTIVYEYIYICIYTCKYINLLILISVCQQPPTCGASAFPCSTFECAHFLWLDGFGFFSISVRARAPAQLVHLFIFRFIII